MTLKLAQFPRTAHAMFRLGLIDFDPLQPDRLVTKGTHPQKEELGKQFLALNVKQISRVVSLQLGETLSLRTRDETGTVNVSRNRLGRLDFNLKLKGSYNLAQLMVNGKSTKKKMMVNGDLSEATFYLDTSDFKAQNIEIYVDKVNLEEHFPKPKKLPLERVVMKPVQFEDFWRVTGQPQEEERLRRLESPLVTYIAPVTMKNLNGRFLVLPLPRNDEPIEWEFNVITSPDGSFTHTLEAREGYLRITSSYNTKAFSKAFVVLVKPNETYEIFEGENKSDIQNFGHFEFGFETQALKGVLEINIIFVLGK